ncbi:hypothetical protein F5B20DRAFT_404388 [Whalleya microplaca]|nr:hypothetical protein F5B20DRAFT_404388 [Whalleya microplaca]
MALRHSASQIFGSKHPALSPREDDDRADCYPWRQRGRAAHAAEQPRTPNSQASAVAANETPAIITLSHFPEPQQPLIPMAAQMSIPFMAPPLQPPQHFTSSSSSSSPTAVAAWGQQTARNTANLHPVFFTARLRRSPFVLDAVAVTSPVAHGYVYHQTQRGLAEGAVPAML